MIGYSPQPGANRTFEPPELTRFAAANGLEFHGIETVCFALALPELEPSRIQASIRESLNTMARAYTATDEAELFDVFADSYTRGFYSEMADRANVRAWIERNLRNYDEFSLGLWAMELKAEGQFIGDCGLTWQEVEGQSELEIGYHVTERERGKGYATEAARACLDFGFTRTSCESICSIVRPANKASCAVAARIHAARREFTKSGQPALLFHTTRCGWEALRVNC